MAYYEAFAGYLALTLRMVVKVAHAVKVAMGVDVEDQTQYVALS